MINIMSLLEQAYQNGRFPSAILLEGQAAYAQEFVHTFLHFLCCEQQSRCGFCASCCLFLADNHLDIEIIGPDEKAHAIKIEQIRALQTIAYQTPMHLSARWIVIHQADTMNANSYNALLKIIEEPPFNTHFILTAENKNFLPKTILSRCWYFVLSQAEQAPTICHPELLAIQQDFLVQLKLYLDEHIDLSQILKSLEAFHIDDVLCFLQYISYQMVHQYYFERKNFDLAFVVAIPVVLWWSFWDKIMQYRLELRAGTHLQSALLLSRLFLILKGNIE